VNRASIQKIPSILLLSFILAACGGGGSGSQNPAGPQPPKNPDEPVKQNYNISIDSANCMKPFFAVRNFQEELASEIGFGDASCVKKIIELGAKATQDVVEFGSGRRHRPLQWAIRDSSLFFAKSSLESFAVVKVLVEAGANMNEKNAAGMNLLHQAITNSEVYKKHPTVAGYLIQSGKIEINALDLSGRSPLHYALTLKESDLAKNLVSSGADINQKNREGLTPLLLAVQNGLDSFALSIVERVTTVDDQDETQSTALHLAIDSKFEALALKLLERTKNINLVNRNGETPLFKAVSQDLFTIVKALSDRAANFDLGTSQESPIHAALRRQVADIVALVISKITKLDTKNSNSNAPLHLAVLLGTDAQVIQLLERGAQVNLGNLNSESALHLAARSNFISKMRILINFKANVNALSAEKRSPLFLVTSTAAAEVLIAEKAVLNLVDTLGDSPLSTMVKRNDTSLSLYLADAGADIRWKSSKNSGLLEISVSSNNLALATYFLEKKLNSNDVNIDGETTLFAAQSVEMLSLLVANGADTNVLSKNKESVLSKRVGQYNSRLGSSQGLELITRLLELGASPKILDQNGNSLVMLSVEAKPLFSGPVGAVRGLPFDNSAIVSLLVKYNADLSVMNKRLSSAIHLADTAQEIRVLEAAGININKKDGTGSTALELNSEALSTLELEINANLKKLETLNEELKKAEANGSTSLVTLYKRQISDLNGVLSFQRAQKGILEEVIQTLRVLGGQ